MITHDLTTLGADLWALGCIIFEMLTGTTLFKGMTMNKLHSNIVNLKYDFPADFDEDAEDLISRLCVACPYERLGAGDPDSEYSMESLMNHPFFKGKKFQKRYKKTPPLGEIEIITKPVTDIDRFT